MEPGKENRMERLRRRGEFLAAAKGFRAPSPAFVLQFRRREDAGPPRIGFTVSRKVGTAVERNRARRRLKEMVRHADMDAISPGCDYVVVARRTALTHPFERLITDFGGALRRVHKGMAADGSATRRPGPQGRGRRRQGQLQDGQPHEGRPHHGQPTRPRT